MSQRGNVVIAQGGGPTSVINASLYGVVCQAVRELGSGSNILGAHNGITGVLQDRWINLREISNQSWDQIVRSPGSALGGCRKMLNIGEAAHAVSILREKDIRYFFYIGGNDSMDTAMRINKAALELGYEMICCGIPKTIDNDLPCTDHCPGFGSAARFIAQSTADLGMDIRSLPTPVSVMEVMGRDAGWLTAATMLARKDHDDAPHLIYLPEIPLTRQKFLSDVQTVYERFGWVVVAVSEGVRDQEGQSWSGRRQEKTEDDFGHRLSGDVATTLASIVTSALGLRARSEKPGLLGRSSVMLVSSVDRREAEEVGAFGFSWANKGNTGFMASIERHPGPAYGISYGAVSLEEVANLTRPLPLDYIADSGNDIKDKYRSYAEPLIGGPLAQYARLDVAQTFTSNLSVKGR